MIFSVFAKEESGKKNQELTENFEEKLILLKCLVNIKEHRSQPQAL